MLGLPHDISDQLLTVVHYHSRSICLHRVKAQRCTRTWVSYIRLFQTINLGLPMNRNEDEVL
jgi:hypothetical protein